MSMNETWYEGVQEDFGQLVIEGDWNGARAMLADLEQMHVDTYELRRQMNEAMSDELEQLELDEEKFSNLKRDNGY